MAAILHHAGHGPSPQRRATTRGACITESARNYTMAGFCLVSSCGPVGGGPAHGRRRARTVRVPLWVIARRLSRTLRRAHWPRAAGRRRAMYATTSRTSASCGGCAARKNRRIFDLASPRRRANGKLICCWSALSSHRKYIQMVVPARNGIMCARRVLVACYGC